MKFLASEKLSEHRYKTPEGYLVCTDAILARTGKQTYRKNEIFDTSDDTEVEIDRPAEEVFNAQTVASFENKPVTVEHPAEDVTPVNYKNHAVGFARDIRKASVDGQDVLVGNLVITDADTIKEIENGEHTELSCGYDCDVSEEELVQRNIRGNHVALCEHGRAGIARIIDSKKDEEEKARPMFDAKTAQGYDVELIVTAPSGRHYAVIHRPGANDYLVAAGYNDKRGDWDQGYYGYKTFEEAKNAVAMARKRAGDELIQSGSEEALRENIRTEIKAGKDPKQAAAIAYRVQRENDAEDSVIPEDPEEVAKKKSEKPGVAAIDSAEWYWIYWKDGGVLSRKSVEAESEEKAIRIFRKNYPDVRIYSVERRDQDPVEDKTYEVHTQDKNGSCRVDIVRAADYIDAVKKARRR